MLSDLSLSLYTAMKRPASALSTKRNTGPSSVKKRPAAEDAAQNESGPADVPTLTPDRVAAYPSYPNQGQSLSMCAVSERCIWASGRDKHVRMYDLKLGRELRQVKLSHCLHPLVALPNGGFLGAHHEGPLLQSTSGIVKLFDEAGKGTMELRHEGWVSHRSIALHPDSNDGFPILIGTVDDPSSAPSEHSLRVFDRCRTERLTVSCGTGDIVGLTWLITGQILLACETPMPPGSRGAKPKLLKIFGASGDLQQTIECGRLLDGVTALPNGNFAVGLRHKIAVYGRSLSDSAWTELSCAAVEPWKHGTISEMVPITTTNENWVLVRCRLKAWVVELGSQRPRALFHLAHPGYVCNIAVVGKYLFTTSDDDLCRFEL